MIKLKKIIERVLKERTMDEDAIFELQDELQYQMFNDFLYNNNEDMTKHVPWQLIKFPRLQKIWEDFVKIGHVRDENGLDAIEDIMVQNALKLYIITRLSGHTSYSPDDDFDEHFNGYLEKYITWYKAKDANPNQYQMNFNKKIGKAMRQSLPKLPPKLNNTYLNDYIEQNELVNLPKDELIKKLSEALGERFFDYYCEDPKTGHLYISDYGLEPLLNYMSKLIKTEDTSEKLYTIDKMLNVVHQRTDLAAWFVDGGSRALSKLSGTDEEE